MASEDKAAEKIYYEAQTYNDTTSNLSTNLCVHKKVAAVFTTRRTISTRRSTWSSVFSVSEKNTGVEGIRRGDKESDGICRQVQSHNMFYYYGIELQKQKVMNYDLAQRTVRFTVT